MRRWVVTGPAGSGKSSLCGIFLDRGAAIVDGDLLGHEILDRDDIVSAIGAEYGPGVVVGGSVDRAALGGLVFADPVALERLNGITHGPLAALAQSRLDKLEKEGSHPLAVFEAAVYFLLPPVPGIDQVITVTSCETIRFSRLTGGGLSSREAHSRIAAQRAMEDGWAGADVVLTNDGPRSDLETSAQALWSRLKD